MKNKEIDAKQAKQERAEKLFGQTPIKKAIWIVAIPSLLAAIMAGLYGFIDQIFILNLVPKNRNIFGNNESEIVQFLNPALHSGGFFSDYKIMIEQYNLHSITKLAEITPNSIVSTASAVFGPLILFSNAIVFLVPVGASIYYTKCVSKQLKRAGQDLWATMFWFTVALSLFATLVSFVFIWSGLLNVLAGETHIDYNIARIAGIDSNALQDYYSAAYSLSIKWAKQFLYIYASGTILQGLTLYLSYFIRAEGYNSYVMICAIVANVINVACDALFIICFKMGVLGGVMATIVGWTFNTITYFAYISIKIKQNKSWLSLSHLFKFKFKKELLGPTFLLGASGFLRIFGISFSFLIMNILITKTSFSMPDYFQYYWAKTQPIIMLFLTSIFGINDGARSLFTYNYSLRNMDRCKQVYKWTILIAILYSVLVYIFIALTSNNLWIWVLNIDPDRIAGTSVFIKVMSLRIIAVSFVVVSLLAFQGSNDIAKSIFASIFENFICFVIIVPIGYGIAWGIFNHDSANRVISNWIIIAVFVFNCVFASSILMFYSWWFVYKKMPYIDQAKVSWSRRIEHKFFEHAEKQEELYNAQMQQEQVNESNNLKQ